MKKITCLLQLILILLLSACVRSEPQGPAERIGRGIDEITRGLQEANQNMNDKERQEAEESIRKEKEIYRKSYGDPDPYYDRDYKSDRLNRDY